MFVFGGIWEKFTDLSSGEIVYTYSIITTEANELMSLVHNNKKRMPLIIQPEKALNWLDENLTEDEIKDFFQPFDTDKLKARPIRKINPRLEYENDPEIIVYYHYEELSHLIAEHPEYFEQSVDLRGESPTLF